MIMVRVLVGAADEIAGTIRKRNKTNVPINNGRGRLFISF
jgi:hypothetical protein